MSKRVLIVEDVADIRRMMQFLLQSYGYEVITARDGYEAVESTKNHSPDLILMDIAMPLMNGIEATKVIRTLYGEQKRIPIICVTAHGDLYRDEALGAGCDDLICKPLDFGNLQPMLDHYLP